MWGTKYVKTEGKFLAALLVTMSQFIITLVGLLDDLVYSFRLSKSIVRFGFIQSPLIYTDKTFLTFLRGFESVQSEQLILELAKQNIEDLNTKRFLSEVKY